MVAARDDAGTDSFRHPGADDEVAYLSFNSNELARSHVDAPSVSGMNPERIRVRDFVQPLRVC